MVTLNIFKLWKKTKEVKAQADAAKKAEQTKKDIEKAKEKYENKKDKEIAKLKATEAHQLSLSNKEYKAYVVVNLVNGTLAEELAVLGAEVGYKNEQPVLRVKDKEENIIFEEPKPDAIDEFNYVDKETVEEKLKDCKDALKKIQSGKVASVNSKYESDWLEEYREWSAKKTHIQLGEKGSYMKIRNGAPHYEFDLVGYFKIPVYRYTSKSTISIPPLGKIITGQVLMKKINDEINADTKDAQKLMNTIFGLLIGVALIGAIILLWKSGQVDVEVSQNFKEAVKSLSSIMNQSADIQAIKIDISNISQSLAPNVTDTVPTKDLGRVLN
ncbi:MAG: hypothetical protein R3250_01160 [Melioribacteraceae bacterium]|nr:hypothetical protein [Melioribacteraceae bacterium]